MDSAALAGELGGAAGGHALFTLRYDTLGMADTVRLAAQTEFLPVLLNRQPVAAWVTLPITFNVLAPRSQPRP